MMATKRMATTVTISHYMINVMLKTHRPVHENLIYIIYYAQKTSCIDHPDVSSVTGDLHIQPLFVYVRNEDSGESVYLRTFA